jgi:acetolactate synthase-1/2/3 large subunit
MAAETSSGPMNGAESLVATLAASGVDLCFTNPGTSEMHFVAALDRVPGVRCVLGLFEGVVTGAADGFHRMAGRPAATLLHLGPGLANGVANLHNARKARSAIVNIVGDHAIGHARFESPLASDLEGIARPVSHWLRTCRSPGEVGHDGAAAIEATRDGGVGRIATLALPADTAWGTGGAVAVARPRQPAPPVPQAAVDRAAQELQRLGPRAVLLLGAAGSASERAQAFAAAIAHKTGCRLLAEFYNARMPGGQGRPRLDRLPYSVDASLDKLRGVELVLLAGALEPIAFFAYPGKPSQLQPPGAALLTLSSPHQDVAGALQALAEALGATTAPLLGAPTPPQAPVDGPLTPDSIGAAVARTLPQACIVIDEGVSTGRGFAPHMAAAAPHDWLQGMGGAIGFGLPLALGAALGAPGRPVLALEGDGSAMYTVQALWSIARESLPVVVVIFANRAYRILQGELQGVGAAISGPKATDMLSLDRPNLDWVSLARGHGVPAARVETSAALERELRRGFASRAPYLIEAVL